MLNQVILIGRLTKDPELKYTQGSGTPVATFTLAVDRPYTNQQGQREADFIPIQVWRKAAENCAKYLAKGSLVAITGRIQTRSWDGNDGKKHYATEVVADTVRFLNSKKQSSNNESDTDILEGFVPVDEEDLPF